MNAALILFTSLGTAYLAARLSRRGAFAAPDLALGLFVGLACLGLERLIGVQGAGLRPSLSLFVACALTLGLESLQHRSSWR